MENTMLVTEAMRLNLARAAEGFSLPRYDAIPDVGLYLDQVATYVNAQFAPLGLPTLTGSMISNYVKQGYLEKPLKKRYSAEQIAYLLFIAAAKTVLSMEDVALFIGMQKKTYDAETAYEYFRAHLEEAVAYVFGRIDALGDSGTTRSEEKTMLRCCVIAIAHVAYLNACFASVKNA